MFSTRMTENMEVSVLSSSRGRRQVNESDQGTYWLRSANEGLYVSQEMV